MQQFRPLPRFDLLEDAEAVEMPFASTTDPLSALDDPQQAITTRSQFVRFIPPSTETDPRVAALPMQAVGTDPQISTPSVQSTGAQARVAKVKLEPLDQPPMSTNPLLAALQQEPRTQTAGRVPIVLLSGSSPTSDTDQLVALCRQTTSTGTYPAFTTALQAASAKKAGLPGETSRLVVIPGARREQQQKSQKASAQRHLNPRFRQAIIFLATVIIAIFTLTTLVPLSDSQSSVNLFSNIGGWIHSAQLDWDIQAQQSQSSQSNFPTALNGPGLPYMPIANSPYVAVAEQAAVNAGIPPVYFVRQIQQESGFNPNAVSVTDAEGIAQFEPYTASGLGINPWDPNSALPGAARLMASYYQQYGNYAKALGAYNAGPGAVQGAVYACGMYWLSCMPGQSQDYVYRIMGV